MSARLGSVDAICYQITHRATAGQDRYNTRWGCEQYYWNDITHPIHLNTGYLKQIILGLNKELQAAKAEVAYEKKCREQQAEKAKYTSIKAQQTIINQKNEEKQYIRSLVDQERRLKNHFYNQYRNQEGLKNRALQKLEQLQTQLNSIKSKANAPETSYTHSNSSDSVTQDQKKTIQDIINNAFKSNNKDKTAQIYKNLREKLSGTWGVVTGLTFGEWSSRYLWEKWLVYNSNKKSILVWKHFQKVTPIPTETSYKFSNSWGDITEDQKKLAGQIINQYILSEDTNLNKVNKIFENLNTNLGGSWGVMIGLELSWCAKTPCSKWLLFSSNLKSVYIWKNYEIQKESKKEQGQQKEEGEEEELLASLFNLQQKPDNTEKKQQENIEVLTEEINHDKNVQVDTEFILVNSSGSPGVEERTFIQVLLNQLVLPTENPFTRVEWVKQLIQKRTEETWGTILNVPLNDWAPQQDYKKWYIFQKNGTQVLIWNKPAIQDVNPLKIEGLTITEPQQKTEEKQEQPQNQTESS